MARKKKSDSATSTKRKTVYELVGERRSPLRRGVDPLDDILLDEERELSREVKRMRLEEIVMRKRREIEKMKQGSDIDMGKLPSNADMLSMAKFLSDLSPEEAQRVRSAYAFFRTMEKGGGGTATLLPMLLNYAQTNPGASENQMINYLKLMDSQFSKGLELARAVNPVQSEDSTMKFLQLMKDLVIEGVRNPLLQAIEKSQPQQGVFEQIIMNPAMFTRFKEIGLFGGGAATTNIDLEIEKLRGERYLQSTKWELEIRRDELKRQADDRRTDNLLAVFGPLAAAFGGPAAQRMQELGKQQAAAHNPMPPSNMIPDMNTVHLLCSCGYQGSEQLTNPPQSEIKCPDCGIMLKVHTGEAPPMEEK